MKQIKNSIWAIAFILLSNTLISQTVDAPYEVGRWRGFRLSAISFTFDDGCPKQFTVALPIFNEFGYKMTFFTVTTSAAGWAPNWTALQNAANQGHEVASHSVTHSHLSSLTTEQVEAELKNAQDEINSRITGQKCITYAYPYCERNSALDSLHSKYYIGARICSGPYVAASPTNFMNLNSQICGTQASGYQTAKALKSTADQAVSYKCWAVFLFHGIDDDGGYSPFSSVELRATLDSLKKYDNKYWVETFGNVTRYIKERNSVSVRQLSFEDSVITLSVTDALPDSIYNYPITIRRPLPQNWAGATITQGDKNIEVKIVNVNSVPYIMFDVVPDAGDVIIKRTESTSVFISENNFPNNPKLLQNYPNPFNPSTAISYRLSASSNVTLKIYDIFGREVTTLVNEQQTPGNYIKQFDASNLASGIYFYRLQVGTYTETKKLTVVK